MDVLPAPIPEDGWTKAKLIERLKLAMKVELSTIPLYLYAFYSINVTGDHHDPKVIAGAEARFAIMAVVQQEMLHLALVGNILRAVDATPILYDDDFIPTYPNKILATNVPMNLTAAGRESFKNFLKIEAPYYPPPPDAEPKNIPDHSIGEFYANLRKGIEILSSDPNLFGKPHVGEQFAGSDFFGEGMIIVKDKDTAFEAIKLITEQGEGGVSSPDSHYQIFASLYHRQQQWSRYDVVDNPKAGTTYPNDTLVYYLARAFDAAYCYLLHTIEAVWTSTEQQRRTHLIKNVHSIMMVIITPLANLLVKQTFKSGQVTKNAAPPFGFYQVPLSNPNQALHTAVKEELGKAKQKAPSGLHCSIDDIVCSVDHNPPVDA